MPVDLAILGFILSFASAILFQFEQSIFNTVDPEGIGPSINSRADATQDKMIAKLVAEMDDDVSRSDLWLGEKDEAKKNALRLRRRYVAQELEEEIWNEAVNYQKIRNCLNSWSGWVRHGRFFANIWTFIDIMLFLILSALVLTSTLPLTIRNDYYWIAVCVIIIPLTYIFVCWLVASYWKHSFDKLLEK